MTATVVWTSVAAAENLARFILQHRHLRQDGTVKPDAFIPDPRREISVTRHLELTNIQLWEIGKTVAQCSGKTLYGQADVLASVFERCELRVTAAPVEGNPNHANVVGWPPDKPKQKALAQQIAEAASVILKPPI